MDAAADDGDPRDPCEGKEESGKGKLCRRNVGVGMERCQVIKKKHQT